MAGEKRTDISAPQRVRARRNNTRRRTASTRSKVAWQRQCRRPLQHPDGDPMAARDTRLPRRDGNAVRHGVTYCPSLKIYSSPESSLFSRSSCPFYASCSRFLPRCAPIRGYTYASLCLFFSSSLTRRCTNRLRENSGRKRR